MKKTIILSSIAALLLTGCNDSLRSDAVSADEIAFAPSTAIASQSTKGYSEGKGFYETYRADIHSAVKPEATARTMIVSAYLHSQEDDSGNYFIGSPFINKGTDKFWHNDGEPVYWPIGGVMDFLAISLSDEVCEDEISIEWDQENAASRVVIDVPAENTQNDILYASAADMRATSISAPVNLTFNHAQAWLEFALTCKNDEGGITKLKRVELENVCLAGKLTVSNNSGIALAEWNLEKEEFGTKPVDNFNTELVLDDSAPLYLDMLIPQQSKCDIIIYYTVGSNPHEMSYRFASDQKTWLMGDKYVYNICINSKEVTVNPTVIPWETAVASKSKVKVQFDHNKGTAELTGTDFTKIDAESTADCNVYECDTWGAIGTLEATAVADGYFFKQWSDGNKENPHKIAITEDITYVTTFGGPTISVSTNNSAWGKVKIDSEEIAYKQVDFPGAEAEIEAIASDGYQFFKWSDESMGNPRTVTVSEDVNYTAIFIPVEAIKGIFSVSPTKKVMFARGNLYANVEFYKEISYAKEIHPTVAIDIVSYDFESEQHYFRMWNSGIEDDQYTNDRAYLASGKTITPPNTVGSFYWAKSALVACSKWYDEESPSIYDTFFAKKIVVNNNTWNTLTYDEWTYLLNISGSGGRSDENRFAKGNISGVVGMLIFPDGYSGTSSGTGIGLVNGAGEEEFPAESIPSGTWKAMESSGVVFIPSSGIREKNNISPESAVGYWSSTTSDKYGALIFAAASPKVDILDFERGLGVSLRLVYELK